jgi:hypothetical protein
MVDVGCWYVLCVVDMSRGVHGLGFSVFGVAKRRLTSKFKKASWAKIMGGWLAQVKFL